MFISHQAPVNRNYFKTGDKIEFLSNTGKITSATAMDDSNEAIPFIFDQILFLDSAEENCLDRWNDKTMRMIPPNLVESVAKTFMFGSVNGGLLFVPPIFDSIIGDNCYEPMKERKNRIATTLERDEVLSWWTSGKIAIDDHGDGACDIIACNVIGVRPLFFLSKEINASLL